LPGRGGRRPAVPRGHPASSFQVLVMVALFWVVRIAVSRRLRERFALPVLTLAGELVAGTALAAAMLIPFAELLAHSGDVDFRVAQHQEARYLLGVFLHDWWGHAPTNLEFATALEEHAYYVAALPLMLTAAALVVRPRPGAHRRGRRGGRDARRRDGHAAIL
jgi:hypothetical protein